MNIENKGLLYGIGAYLMWGFFPLYFKLLDTIPALQIVAHRILWSFLLLTLVIGMRHEWQDMQKVARSGKNLLIYLLAALLLACNWLVYVWAVNAGHVVEASLGYFINPLVNMALGVLLLRERLRPFQWLPVGLAALGVLYLTLEFGQLPWIALALAFSFGFYGLVKKVAPLGSLYGLTLETALLFLPALAYLLLAQSQGVGAFGNLGWGMSLLITLSGLVTTLPLLLFASAARSLPLSMMGLLQYVAPTCQFLLGILVFKEPFSPAQLVGFSLVWLGLILFTAESFWVRGRLAAKAVS